MEIRSRLNTNNSNNLFLDQPANSIFQNTESESKTVLSKMEAFPCPVERTVASALLLLSASPPLPTESKRSCAESLVSSNSKSSSSSVTSDDGSSAEFRDYGLRFFTVVAPFHQMKLKVVRKSRSKNFQSPGRWKMMPSKPAMKTSESPSVTTEASSCLSSSSSAISSARDCNFTRIGKREALARDLKKKPVSSAIIRRRAEAILKLLSNGCASEVRIRQLLGDSPDTSKALRMLLKLEEVKRSGAGGRSDPYIYTIA